MLSKLRQYIRDNRAELITLTILLVVAALVHGWNMFHFPYFENDEATYVSQAWSFINEGKLSPYTYYYDHAPGGWLLLGIWFKLTGGLTTFGTEPIYSGRIFILILHLASVGLLYVITNRISKSRLAAIFAVAILIFSPLEIYFGRRVLLDNIMMFWILLSLFLATSPGHKLRTVLLSAVTFGIAVLTKENALFFGPAILYIAVIYGQKVHRNWRVTQWLAATGAIVIIYPLYALLRGELFQSGSIFDRGGSHVSLIATTIDQGSRGTFAFPWQHNSDFFLNLQEWLQRDPFIILAGAVSIIAIMALNYRYRELKAIALTALAATVFLARGKLILDFYVLSILPLFAMCIGMMFTLPMKWGKEHISSRNYTVIVAAVLSIIFLSSSWLPLFTKDETSNQDRAMTWVSNNVDLDKHIAIDDYAYPYLHDTKHFTGADWFQKIQLDPAINEKYAENWEKIDYIVLSHDMLKSIRNDQAPLIKQALLHSQLVADFRNGSSSHINLKQYISTNGDWAQVYRVDRKNSGLLVDSWRAYKQNYISGTGQVSDPATSSTTSEGQSYAMLRSLNAGDRATFELVWQWTKKNMQVRDSDKLFAWKFVIEKDGSTHLDDRNAATDADEDIAYSLAQAGKKWGNTTYISEAATIINDIWNNETIQKLGTRYVLSAPSEDKGGQLLVNPSYLAPADYRIFAGIDPKHDWDKVASDSYALLNRVQARSSAGLFSNWIAVNPDGTLSSADGLAVNGADTFGYDAFRINWRMADDKQDPRAQAILLKLASFYASEWTKHRLISAEYDLNGGAKSQYSDIPGSAGAIIGLHAVNNGIAYEIYREEIMPRYHAGKTYWGQPWNYYSQNWAAFSVQYLGIGGLGSSGDKL